MSDIYTCITIESLDGCQCGPGLQWKCEEYEREREYGLGKEERGIEVKLAFTNINTCGATGEIFVADP